MRLRTERFWRKAVAASVAAALIVTAPGLPLYQALAADLKGEGRAAPRATPNVSPVVPVGNIGAGLNPVGAANTNTSAAAGASANAAAASAQPAVASALPGGASLRAPAANPGAKTPAVSGAPAQTGAAEPQTASQTGASVESPDAPSAAAGAPAVAVGAPAAPLANETAADSGARFFDGARSWLRKTFGPKPQAERVEPTLSAPQLSPAQRAQARLMAGADAEAQRNADLLVQVLKQQAKGGAAPSTIYAFFDSDGRLQRAAQSPRGSGVSLELRVGEKGALTLATDADGKLSQHNRMARGQFKSRRVDGFAVAQRALSAAQPLVTRALSGGETVPEPETQPQAQPQAETKPAERKLITLEPEAKPNARPVTVWHELAALALVGAAATGGFLAFSWAGLGVGMVVTAVAADYYLSKLRKKYNDDVAAARRIDRQNAEAEKFGNAPVLAAAPAPAPAVAPAAAPEPKAAEPEPKAAEPAAEEPAAETETAAAALKTPASWKSLPAEAREWDAAKLVEAKADALRRARAVASDAQLVGVAINLKDSRAHWAFTFQSKKKGLSITVRPKSIETKRWPKSKKAAPLWDSRLGKMGALEQAYALLKDQKAWFAPERVEIVPAWNGDPSWKFTDGRGREHYVAGTPQAKTPRTEVDAALGRGGEAASFGSLPADAQIVALDLATLKAAAQKRARAKSPDAQLVGVSIRLDDPRAHWNFDFQSRRDAKALKVYPKRIEDEPLGRSLRAPIWDSRVGTAATFKTAYTALKRAQSSFKPVQAQLEGVWNGDPVWVFTDASGRAIRVTGREQAEKTPPQTGPPEDRGPPETAPPPEAPPPTAPAPPDGAGSPPKDGQPEKSEPQPKQNGPHIHEGFFGFRWVQGLKHQDADDAPLKPLPVKPTREQIVNQLSKQFDIPRDRVLALADKAGLKGDEDAARWMAAWDNMRASNREQFKRFDHKKYSGWGSFRDLANVKYAPGAQGALQRTLELHKHFAGFFIRFPYHLFDQFVLGYFRQNIAYEFAHGQEDFINLVQSGLAEKYLMAAFTKAANGNVRLAQIRANALFRWFDRYVWTPLLGPLTQFMKRRLTMAVLSAVAMGALGAAAPALTLFGVPIMSISLTAIPGLGDALVFVLNGAPALLGQVPVLGGFLAPIVAEATGALLKDLVVGPMLNTLMLSSMLTLPHAMRERVAMLKEKDPEKRIKALSPEMARAILGALFSGAFWRSNMKSFVGMITVGAEIQGIMTYAGQLDAGASDLTGHHVTVMHDLASAVEKPQGESVIPFGGAITWGNVLLYKAQEAVGFNISDNVMHWLNPGLKDHKAQEIVGAASHRPDQADAKKTFDPDLYKKSPAEIAERLKELGKNAGELDAEIAAAKLHAERLAAQLSGDQKKLAELQKLSNPVTPEEKARLDALRKQLAGAVDEGYAKDKLGEVHDLKNPLPDSHQKIKDLDALLAQYEKDLVDRSGDRPAVKDDLALREAELVALRKHLTRVMEPQKDPGLNGGSTALPESTKAAIVELVTKIESLRAEARGEMSNRDATRQLLAVQNKARNEALRDRRNGKEMLEFHKNMSRLDTVMQIALALNEIGAAEKAIKDMMDMIDAKIAKIKDSQTRNAQGQQQAQQNQQDVQKWKDELNQTIKDDKATQDRIVDNEFKAHSAVDRIRGFQTDVNALINRINGRDGGSSGDAQREYQRRIDMLDKVVEWRTNGGNPNDPDAFSLKKFQDNLAEIDDNIAKAKDGLSQLPGVPVEFAGATIVLIPGPKVTISNPSQSQTLQILADRKVYWEGRKTEFKKSLDSIDRMMDGSNTRTVVDEFGDAHPESLPRWRAQQQTVLTDSQSRVQRNAAAIDAAAAQISQVTGTSLPRLSGLTLTQLRDTIKTYGDKVKAVKVPAGDSKEGHMASMNLILIADLLPDTADNVVQWAKADATVTAIDKAISQTLPPARQKLAGVVQMMDDVLADVELDKQYVTSGGNNQALLDRKTALLRDKILPPLQGARSLIADTLIPYQKESIEQAKPNTGDLWTLFDAQKTIITTSKELYKETLPWALATYGAEKGNASAGHASIKQWRDDIKKNITGYDDAQGHHKGVAEYRQELANRKDPNYSGTEVLYGETQPFSLPKKIAQYNAEKGTRAAQINQQATTINEILGKIETLSKGKYNLQSYRFPTDVTADPAGVAKVQSVVDRKLITDLADKLKQIGDEQNQGGSDINIGGNTSTVPTGPQPPITLADSQQMALLALDAAKRLVPTSLGQPQSAPAAYAIARFLYSDAVAKGAQDALTNQVPAAELFLKHAEDALNAAVDQTAKDDAYVDSNGSSESPEQLYARKVATFQALTDFLNEGVQFFNLKSQWNNDGFSTIDSVSNYYNGLNDIYNGGSTANNSEITAANQMKAALQKTFDGLEAKRLKFGTWMGQLNDPNFSALARVSDSVSKLQTETRAVLEANVKYHELNDQLGRSNDILRAKLAEIDDAQQDLAALLDKNKAAVQGGLPVDVVNRIEALRMSRGAWAIGSADEPGGAIVVKKAEFSAFLDTVLKMFEHQRSAQDLAMIKQDLLANPQGLSALIPDAQMLDFGDTADGFYMVYQSRFSVPHGLETGSWVTLGNVARAWGNNVSVTGYAFSSPPNEENAPYGDKGVEVQIESLQGKNWVNYLNVDFHRFAFDIPPDGSAVESAKQSRMMIFDDFAVMLFGDRLYIGMAGFTDFALDSPNDHPKYYGGNFKTSLKLTEVMRLNAEQQVLFAKDPRTFLQQVNLDFTGYDPDLNRNFNIVANGENKSYSRTQVGPSFDVAKLLGQQSGDAFTVDLFWAKTSGTDDYNQQTVGASILKGFTLRNNDGKPWAVINNRATGELGQHHNTFTDRLSVTLPDQGIVVSGQGQLLGTSKAYYGEIAKKMGDNSNIALGYGSPYVGMNNRLSLTMNTSFTLGELWQAVVDHNREDLKGGEQLKQFNKQLDDFFKTDASGAEPSKKVQELKRVFEQDVARKLISQDIGTLRREIDELRKAGAFMDNSRVRGMVGFVSAPVSEDEAERAVGGGFVVGTQTDITLTKTQKALIEAKAQTLYREGLRLQQRMLDLTKEWQATVAEIAQAQWDMKLAEFMVQNAGSVALREQGRVRSAEAQARLHQALLKYNMLSGRNPTDPVPFDNLNAADLQVLLAEIRKTIRGEDRMTEILGALNEEDMKKALGDTKPFNLMDWIPWVDKLTIGVGTQLQDMMANQVLTVGLTVRLPVYDPKSKGTNNAYQLESKATIEEMKQAQEERALSVQKELEQARLWGLSADAARPGLPQAAKDLSMAIRAYRNNLIGPAELQKAFDSWRWYAGSVLDADTRSALAEAFAAVDQPFAPKLEADNETVRVTKLEDAFTLVTERSHSLAEVALRQQAAAEMTKANDARIQKAWVDVTVGSGFTATGVGWLPSIGVTGIPVTPIIGFEFKPEELRELQVRQGKSQTEYYGFLQKKLEAGLAVQFYQNIVAYQTARGAVNIFDNSLLPKLQAEVDAQGSGGATNADKVAAQRKLDDAKMRRQQAELALRQSQATLNFLLGRPGDASLRIDVTVDEARASLQRLLAEKKPVETQKGLLDARVDVARAVETMVDKDLKVEQLALEPVSLTVRSLGRLIDALASENIGNPDLVAAARVQTLNEERARESYDKQLEVQKARTFTALKAIQDQLNDLRGKTDPSSRLRFQLLSGREADLTAALMAMGADPRVPPGGDAALPNTFAELTNRLRQAEQGLAAQMPEKPVEMFDPETMRHQAAGFLRYYYAKQTLGHEKIDREYGEGWVEVRLKYYETDPETLLNLARLRQQKADRIYTTQLAGARSKGAILAADFETNVQLRRWAQASMGQKNGPTAGSLNRFVDEMNDRLKAQRDEIVALLNLPPTTTVEQLASLVQDAPSGNRDLRAVSEDFVGRVRKLQLEEIRNTLFDGALAGQLGNEDDLIHQLRADTIAERMSYKGFTPVAAFGVFRGKFIAGGFLEAPDPRDIQRGLENVLSDVLRKDLESSGRMKELTLHLHSLMARVEDGSHELERRRELVEASEADYRSQMGRMKDGVMGPEAVAARQRLVDAWLGFSQQMVQTKSDFIALVAELEALGQGRDNGDALQPFVKPMRRELPELRRDRKADLLSYMTDRMLDDGFRAELRARLETKAGEKGYEDLPDLLAAIDRRADLFALADRDASVVLARDFTPTEKLDLLTRNDREGKREALAAEIERALNKFGGIDNQGSLLLGFVEKDLEAQAKKNGADRARYMELGTYVRDGMWKALPAPRSVQGAYVEVERLREAAESARQQLLESYLSDAGDEPNNFLLKDTLLDGYLKAQQAYDESVISLFKMKEVKSSDELIWRLDGFFDLRTVVQRQRDYAQAGRGMLALDALIMLEESRLAAARWQGRGPMRIDRIALALETLRQKKSEWKGGGVDLVPLYAKTKVVRDGETQWSVDGWMTSEEFRDAVDRKEIAQEGDRWFLTDKKSGTRYLIRGGIDASEETRDKAQTELDAARGRLASYDAMNGDADFALDRPLPDGRKALKVADIFDGPKSERAQGRLFYFQIKDDKGEPLKGLHPAIHPLQALKMPPDRYVLLDYRGDLKIGRDRYPTLESLRASGEAKDFYTLLLSKDGARHLIERALEQRSAEMRTGWIDLKLNSYGFARDENGGIGEMYLTKDEFEAQIKAFQHAREDLVTLNKELVKAREKSERLKDEARAKQEAARVAGLKYQAVQAQLRAEYADQVEGKLEQGARESDQLFQARVKLEVDKLLAQDKRFKAAQDEFDPYAKAYADAVAELKHADADVRNAEKNVDAGELMVARSKSWSLYRSKDLALELDADGAVVGASGSPAYGALALRESMPGGPVASTMRGELLAASVDGKGRIVHYYQDPDAVAEYAKRWSLTTVEMPDESIPVGSKTIAPRYRLAYYEEPGRAPGEKAKVLLSRRYMIDRAEAAQKGLTRAEYYGIMPWNWGSLLLELPRGVVGTPMELITGRDPRQQHYLGRVYMYKTEGGATEHHGFFRKVADFVDVLDFLPDPVDRYYDASQFPDEVQIDSPILPGQTIYQKDMRTVDGKKDVHFGAGMLKRQGRQSLEDLTAARERTLAHFHGGTETVLIETLRGRAVGADGNAKRYTDSHVRGASGSKALDRALADPVIGFDPKSDGSGTVLTSENPGNILVDNVERRVTVRTGADDLQAQADVLDDYGARLDRRIEDEQRLRGDLEKVVADAQAKFDNAVRDRAGVRERLAAARELERALSWRIRAQEALERDIAALDAKIEALRLTLDFWREYLKRLAGLQRGEQPAPLPTPTQPAPKPDPNQPAPLPTTPNPAADGNLWVWALTLFGLGSLAAAAYALYRRRRSLDPDDGTPRA